MGAGERCGGFYICVRSVLFVSVVYVASTPASGFGGFVSCSGFSAVYIGEETRRSSDPSGGPAAAKVAAPVDTPRAKGVGIFRPYSVVRYGVDPAPKAGPAILDT